MPIEYLTGRARLQGYCTAEEAEGLLEWILQHPQGAVDLSEAEHIHTAILQVLQCAKPAIAGSPHDPFLRTLIGDGSAELRGEPQ
jgi:hypothetical protein